VSEDRDQDTDIQAAFERARAVKRARENELLSKANVVGVGLGMREKGGARQDEVVIVVMVQQKVPRSQLAPEDIVPATIDGVPVDVQEVGTLTVH
jgi:hypothetical protein